MRTLIQGGWIVGYQHGHHAILRAGVVVFDGDRILYVGPNFAGRVDKTIDARGKLVSPGFVNMHAVANIDIQTMMLDARSIGFAVSEAYAVEGKGTLELGEERLRTSARFSLVQLLKGGSTTIVEITAMGPSRLEVPRDEVSILAETAAELGARIYVSHKFRAGRRYLHQSGSWRYYWDETAAEDAFAYGCEIVKHYEGTHGDRVRTMLFPYQFDASTPALLQQVKAAARELNVPVHLHTSQSLFEFHDSLRRYNRTPAQVLGDIGFLDENTILTHLLYTTLHPQSGYPEGDDSDLRIVAEHGTTVVHCPIVFARRGKALGSFARYHEAGINVVLGTDTFPQDMIEEMRWAALTCKWIDRDANRGTARDLFNAATLAGASALGRDDIGRTVPGAKADIVIVDFTRPHIGPVDDPIKTLVYAASGADIETVIVDGRTVVDKGRVPGIDESQLIQDATEAHRWQKGQFATLHPLNHSEDELFPPSYPIYAL